MRSSNDLRSLIAMVVAALSGCGGNGSMPTEGLQVVQTDAGSQPTAAVRVLSSAPQWVSGGDARIEVRAVPGLHGQLQIWINGRRTAQSLASQGDRLDGVVSGFAVGGNLLEIRDQHGRRVLASLRLNNHPITGPMFSGPQQQPFVCNTSQFGLQPKIDSRVPPGHAVRPGGGNLVAGFSRNCSIDTFVTYLYRSTDHSWKTLPSNGNAPADMTQVTLPDGRTVDFVVRREVGSINRFLYSFAMLAPRSERAAQPDLGLWNKRLVYYFQGGVAIGHTQGSVNSRSLNADLLRQGYAIAHSSGNNTGTHYNLQVASETAMMTKERFIERYGLPLYTVGLGASGGAIQQYMLAQNHPGVLDAALPAQSYPDMVTQTIHVGDCELLEHYMDVTDRGNSRWQQAKNRTLLVGFNAEQTVADPLAPIKSRIGFAGASMSTGSTECSHAWRGLWPPLVANPWYGSVRHQEEYVPQSDIAAIRWTHFDDLRHIYGVDPDGWARPTWDNVGVQYGLKSLKQGRITPAEFLDVNFKVGGWKQPRQMIQEAFPFLSGITEDMAVNDPSLFDPWSRRNMNLSASPGTPAARTEGDPIAMRAAYTSGMVFGGQMPVPTIDHRQYMERELDMHNVHQSFAVRKRVLQKMGTTDHLVIWFTDTVPGVPKASQSLEALAVMDEWMANIRAHPGKTMAENRPARAVDSCFDAKGRLMHAGPTVWDGVIDDKPKGACTRAFPMFGTSRTVAGAPLEGGVYKCALKSVDTALRDGTYEPWAPDAAAIASLKRVFPHGVCDYARPDQARP
ncbi:DUF6351 family protein [Aquabacterium sp. A7-Y]|uniref:DUF6351 family protein n=1 Tax=Aquabacterium sp. A7-Y TaxID=1349605 RepID=UPI00223CF2E3|nr:DUF6351 family protein [Aquabacterium sp. A7-Y]MCW7541110.1 DUF6351 family protein [Aquabacterium sp. A7-Y]